MQCWLDTDIGDDIAILEIQIKLNFTLMTPDDVYFYPYYKYNTLQDMLKMSEGDFLLLDDGIKKLEAAERTVVCLFTNL